MRREYKLAGDPIRLRSGQVRREILEITEDGHRSVLLVVANDDAMDVRDALARAYTDGREDNAAMLDAEGLLLRTKPPQPHYHDATGYEDTPCTCPSPATYAPQWGKTGSDEGGAGA